MTERYDDSEFAIIGMNIGDKRDLINEVFRLRKLSWKSFYFGQNYRVPDSVGVQTFPTYIVLDRNLKIRSVTHAVDYRTINDLVDP